MLRTNYRCPRNLVAMAARLIGHNTRRVPKESLPGRADEADVRVWHCVNAGSEAQILARFIRRLHDEHAGRGLRFADVAILTRMNSQSLPLQIALILEGIPFHCRREENVLLSETTCGCGRTRATTRRRRRGSSAGAASAISRPRPSRRSTAW